MDADRLRQRLFERLAIPAHPLALDANRKIDERRQRALTRYYAAAGAGGVAVGVHTTQFAIREHGLLPPVLEMAAAAVQAEGLIRIAGVCGPTLQAVREAELARGFGYDAVLLSLAALPNATTRKLVEHTAAVAEILPVFGFYLQPAVGGRVLPYDFWRRFLEIPNIVAIKMAPFNRYQTIDVVRALAASGRQNEVALYTGNDDNIIADLVTPFAVGGSTVRIAGGLLGQFAVWTRRAADIVRTIPDTPVCEALSLGTRLTDANAAIFDAANAFHGCIPGIHEILRRQGLLVGRWCLDPAEELSDGQMQEIDRVCSAYPELNDDDFVRAHLDEWLS